MLLCYIILCTDIKTSQVSIIVPTQYTNQKHIPRLSIKSARIRNNIFHCVFVWFFVSSNFIHLYAHNVVKIISEDPRYLHLLPIVQQLNNHYLFNDLGLSRNNNPKLSMYRVSHCSCRKTIVRKQNEHCYHLVNYICYNYT